MGLKNLFKTMKNEGYIIKRLDQYLLTQVKKDADRRWDINSPSMASQCSRAIYYSRKDVPRDGDAIDARTQRIFDNGTGVHERLQAYMEDEGILLMPEVPVLDQDLQVQGHTDGILELNKYEVGVLEIKSINTNGFSSLVDAKDEHKTQAQIYMMCLEKERQGIKEKCPTKRDLNIYLRSKEFYNFYAGMYQHLKGGSHYTREEKIEFKVKQHKQACRILWGAVRPITKMVFLYEDKNTQELKEFVVQWDDNRVKEIEDKLKKVNKSLKTNKVPPREGTSRSCATCRWCSWKGECWIV